MRLIKLIFLLFFVVNYLSAQQVTTFAGSGVAGFANGFGTNAQFNSPFGIAIDSLNNLYICDVMNNLIRKIDSLGNVTTFAGSGVQGFLDGPALSSNWYNPWGICISPDGSLIIGTNGNERLRKIENDMVTTIAGSGITGNQLGPAMSAQFNKPYGVCLDTAGNIFFVDRYNHQVKKLTNTGMVVLVAGSGAIGFADGPAASATFAHPQDITIDAVGNLYVSDIDNHSIRKISTTGVVSTFAGNGTAGFQDGIGTQAKFNVPVGLFLDPCGNLFVTDHENHRIRKVDPSGNVTTVAGSGIAGFLNGPASTARFNLPFGLVKDKSGNIFITDRANHGVRKISMQTGESKIIIACEGMAINLQLPPADSVSWFPASGLSCNNCINPEHLATANTQFIAYSYKDCEIRKDTFNIIINNCKADTTDYTNEILIPNVISPNNDGQNDFFVIKNIPPNTLVTIFNRWGNKVFESYNYQNDWGGLNLRGEKVSEGTYFYSIKFGDSIKGINGIITVIR
jgi:gliding motility-associated-like protein